MTVVDVIADGLARAGTPRVFAVSRTPSVVATCDAFRRRGLTVLEVARASDACVMAAVSGALAGVPGAAVIGDGLASALDGLACAFFDRLPVVVIGASASPAGARPVRAQLSGMTKATLAVEPDSAAHWIAHACRLAMAEPWGPVHLDVAPAIEAAAALPVATVCRPGPPPAPAPAALDTAVRLLRTVERPLVVAGLLCRSEADAAWIRAFAEARPAPVLVTPKARGVLPDPHPLALGTLGAGEAERRVLESADLIVAIGLDPAEDRGPAWPAATAVLHLTPVPPEQLLGDREAAVVADIALTLEELAPRLRDVRLAEWDVARLHALKQMAAAPPADTERLAAYRVVEVARRLTPPGTIAVFEGRDAPATAARAWLATAPGECMIAIGPAGEGFALARAMAAQLARPERRVVCFTEAAALPADADRLEMVGALGLPMLIVALNQSAGPPPASLARDAGLRVFTSTTIDAFVAAFERALAAMAPALIEARGGSPMSARWA